VKTTIGGDFRRAGQKVQTSQRFAPITGEGPKGCARTVSNGLLSALPPRAALAGDKWAG
jgi:hypothetical protein